MFIILHPSQGEIPVELLRLKIVKKRTVQLGGNAGLMLPLNIGALGDAVTRIDLNNLGLCGEFGIRPYPSDFPNRNAGAHAQQARLGRHVPLLPE